jgi:nucleoside-diphosphate-sugar epimerase
MTGIDNLNEIINEDVQNIIGKNIPWEKFANKTVLITGATGFLPAYMLYTLLALNKRFDYNIKILALARNKEKVFRKFSDIKSPELEFIIQDVCEPINIDSPINFVIHAASQASPKYYGVDPVGTLNANVIGTNNLLKISSRRISVF